MALNTTVAAVLRTIKAAPASIGAEQISSLSGVAFNLVANVINELIAANYIKENRANPGTFFTRQPRRIAIESFLANYANGLEGMSMENPGGAVAFNTLEQQYVSVLGQIMDHEGAMHKDRIVFVGNLNNILDDLLTAQLIKEHADYENCYFTRSPMRLKISCFIDGNVTVDTLLDATQKNESFSRTDDCNEFVQQPEEVPSPVVPQTFPPVAAPAVCAPAASPVATHVLPTVPGDMASLLDAMQTIRVIADIFLRTHGRN